ncbi:MAG: sigma-54 interaction domain-containing protein [Lautropia sp.]
MPIPPTTALDAIGQMLETHEAPSVLIDDDYRIVASNAAYRRAYGVDAHAIVGRACHRVSHHSAVPCHERGEDCPLQRVRQTVAPVDTMHIHFRPDGSPERVRVRGYPVSIDSRRLLVERIERLDAPAGSGRRASERMVGRSPALLATLHRLTRAAAMPGGVLITGESGVGKELAARFVHEHSAQATGPFVVADCAALPESLFEAELFGHERGAFTGAHAARAGLFEAADGGTLLLDEIGELPLAMQSKLLRAIDSGEIRRLGARQPRPVRVRIVAATNREPAAMVSDGSFRLDLYYRLAAHEIRMPPLRERREDIVPIAEALVGERLPGARLALDARARRALESLALPGNVRELRNLLERAVGVDGRIDATMLAAPHRPAGGRPLPSAPSPVREAARATPPATDAGARPLGAALDDWRRRLLAQAIERHAGHRARIAADLGVSERTVYRWMRARANRR